MILSESGARGKAGDRPPLASSQLALAAAAPVGTVRLAGVALGRSTAGVTRRETAGASQAHRLRAATLASLFRGLSRTEKRGARTLAAETQQTVLRQLFPTSSVLRGMEDGCKIHRLYEVTTGTSLSHAPVLAS